MSEKQGTQDMVRRFNHHSPPTPEAGEPLGEIREQCQDLAIALLALCPEGRERSVAITKLEEAMFWANASIARTWP